MNRRLFALLAILAGLLLGASAMAASGAVTDDPLRARLKALAPPWYDAERDTWQKVESAAPKPPPALPEARVPGASPFVTFIAWLVAALLLTALAWLIWQLLPKEPGLALPEPHKPASVRDAHATLLELDVGEPGDPELALAAAKQAEQWSRAVVWLYAILLVRLDRAGVVRVRRGATNRRYRLEVADWTASGEALQQAAPELLPTVDAVISAFERAYFGQQPTDRALVERLEARIRRVMRALPVEAER